MWELKWEGEIDIRGLKYYRFKPKGNPKPVDYPICKLSFGGYKLDKRGNILFDENGEPMHHSAIDIRCMQEMFLSERFENEPKGEKNVGKWNYVIRGVRPHNMEWYWQYTGQYDKYPVKRGTAKAQHKDLNSWITVWDDDKPIKSKRKFFPNGESEPFTKYMFDIPTEPEHIIENGLVYIKYPKINPATIRCGIQNDTL
jgi:hypothetical protein